MTGEKKMVGGFFKSLTGKWHTKTPDPKLDLTTLKPISAKDLSFLPAADPGAPVHATMPTWLDAIGKTSKKQAAPPKVIGTSLL